jgi:putative heme iron utilization protein
MMMNLYERVALKVAVQGHDVRPGDVATVVDVVEHPSRGPRGCVLEFFNATGDSLRVLTVPEDAIEPLRPDEVFSVRPLAVSR